MLSRVAVRGATCTSSVSRKGLSGYVVPSRLYGILAAGRPVIVGGRCRQRDGAARRARSAAGSSCPPGGPELVARRSATRTTASYDLEEMGAAGAEYVELEADSSVAIGRYRELLRDLAGRLASSSCWC